MRAKKYVVKKKFNGLPRREDYEIVEYELPPLQDGEILVKTEWISVDPYLRVFNPHMPVPYDQFGYQVGVVVESKNPNYPIGTDVVSHVGWCDYSVMNPDASSKATDPIFKSVDRVDKLPSLEGLSKSHGVGAVGMPGASAYFKFLEVCKPQPGETVVVTGAAGAVGSIVGQIAKIKGCKVIGFAGSDRKVQWLKKELGFDEAFNYKTVNVATALKEAAPEGIDCYFDNVGGEISDVIISQMKSLGRISLCGSISSYNEDKLSKPTIRLREILNQQLTIEAIGVWYYRNRWDEAFTDIVRWIKNGQLKVEEHITEGFDNVVDAFRGMLEGENLGKAVVKV